MRTPHVTDLNNLDIALVGVPYDGAVEARSGARQGPRQIRDMSSMMRTIQIGIRGAANSDECWAFGPKHGIRIVYIEEFNKLGVEKVITEARRVVGEGPTYVSFDIDSLDPSFAPGTGPPEIGSLTTIEAQALIRGLRGLNLVGADVVEVSPPFDSSGITALIAATIMYEMLCILSEIIDLKSKKKGLRYITANLLDN